MDQLLKIGGYLVAHSAELIGFIMPPIVEFLNKDVKDEKERFIVALLACLGAAVLLHWGDVMDGSIDTFFVTLGVIIAESQVVFKLYFKNSDLRLRLQDKMLDNKDTGTTSSDLATP